MGDEINHQQGDFLKAFYIYTDRFKQISIQIEQKFNKL